MHIHLEYKCSKCDSTNVEHFQRGTEIKGTRCLKCGHEKIDARSNFMTDTIYTDDGSPIKF